MPRLLLLALIAIGLAPGTFLRTPTSARDDPLSVAVTPVAQRDGLHGVLTLTAAWELTSAHSRFGGFSALVAGGEGGLIAGSDRGFLMPLAVDGPAPRAGPARFAFGGRKANGFDRVIDLEALARDPATGTLWAAIENLNRIDRIGPGGERRSVRPAQLAGWRSNSGPETMERLGDGRFLVLAEGAERRGMAHRPALLYPGDPLAGQPALAFRFASGADYAPVDAAQLPDGRVLILLRRVRYGIPVRFDTAIAIADPRAIRPGQQWRGRVIQRLYGGVFADNFEGIAFVPDRAGATHGSIWLISDDNFSVFQRTVLLRFAWPGGR